MSPFRAVLAAVFLGVFTLPALAVELVMVEEPGCPWCAKWERELGAIYPKTAEGQAAPLRKVQLHDLRRKGGPDSLGIALERPVMFTPTFLLIGDGGELARIEGYPGEDFFWGLLKVMLVEKTGFTPDATPPAGATDQTPD
ncbi:thioredoxin family protein [Aliiroseovarius sp. S2029]|uniref:thioredoxin family protein n=1 Tax=Aliiroseovarius sp. S2029 TaxID=2936988 RepID=UPI0020C140E2|nr:thioredoxin family protein [Aliiroseovarius sp. S2029]MCK8484958.1 thioredoxin family protein [Aliiroseovarius sp. S2029]